MCKRNGELVDHLLLHCPIVYELWFMVFTLFGIYWAMPKTMVKHPACWQGNFGHHHNGVIWMVVPHCLVWCIWRERNNQCFEILKGIYVFDYFVPLLYTSCMLGRLIIMSLNKIFFTYQKKKKKEKKRISNCCPIPLSGWESMGWIQIAVPTPYNHIING